MFRAQEHAHRQGDDRPAKRHRSDHHREVLVQGQSTECLAFECYDPPLGVGQRAYRFRPDVLVQPFPKDAPTQVKKTINCAQWAAGE